LSTNDCIVYSIQILHCMGIRRQGKGCFPDFLEYVISVYTLLIPLLSHFISSSTLLSPTNNKAKKLYLRKKKKKHFNWSARNEMKRTQVLGDPKFREPQQLLSNFTFTRETYRPKNQTIWYSKSNSYISSSSLFSNFNCPYGPWGLF